MEGAESASQQTNTPSPEEIEHHVQINQGSRMARTELQLPDLMHGSHHSKAELVIPLGKGFIGQGAGDDGKSR